MDDEDDFEGTVKVLPAEKCVSVRFCGGHRDAAEYYRMLFAYIKEHGLQISGFSREVTMIDDGLTADREKFVTQIQIPVDTK